MNAKKELIIKNAAELFAVNGYDATSIQQITDSCGISKGSFYLSFKSKESLLGGIISYFSERIVERAEGMFAKDLTSGERFEQSLSVYFEELEHYSPFILTLIREQANPMSDSLRVMLENLRRKMYRMQERLLIDLYGEGYRDRMPDLITMLNGILKGYIELIVFNKGELDHTRLPAFIRQAMDALTAAVGTPFLSTRELIEFHCVPDGDSLPSETLIGLLDEVQEDTGSTEEERVSAEMIKTELLSGTPRRAVVSGMSTNLLHSEKGREAEAAVSEWLAAD
ncbi:TetR family transcriptional regulator [Sporosarcina sp. NCCP-2716]|uniref:TetR/AcrR family transcriptional regulator n=1 Tax=Sporosarcina sp. NCCP-2716 TaxID=2943679 RepID=UPI00203B9C6C|nr:TetR/AcrR family transcriptional regulator [Sporosarcina sp. NCCP-2716]GKV68155.1 TetR family transcriptional regulator [Sporosarcina sp. NCCP-2716]